MDRNIHDKDIILLTLQNLIKIQDNKLCEEWIHKTKEEIEEVFKQILFYFQLIFFFPIKKMM